MNTTKMMEDWNKHEARAPQGWTYARGIARMRGGTLKTDGLLRTFDVDENLRIRAEVWYVSAWRNGVYGFVPTAFFTVFKRNKHKQFCCEEKDRNVFFKEADGELPAQARRYYAKLCDFAATITRAEIMEAYNDLMLWRSTERIVNAHAENEGAK